MIGVGFVGETRSVKCFAEVIYARFRWLGGKETGTPETVHQRKHRQLRYKYYIYILYKRTADKQFWCTPPHSIINNNIKKYFAEPYWS